MGPLEERRSSSAEVDLNGGPEVSTFIAAYPHPVVDVLSEPFVKRLLDMTVAFVGLMLSLPLLVAITVAIKLEDRGPVLYAQERWGKGGRPFKLHKFRTMAVESDHKFGIVQAIENDHRATRVGRVLRATGMDELPQLLSILRGRMSFVGPRALAVGEVVHDENGDRIDYEGLPGFWKRLSVRPGLTGPATIYLPKDATPETKLEYDLRYVREQSFGLDVRLILLSLWISLRGKWETRAPKL